MKRKIIRIDEVKCNGCGLCVPSCAEGAIEIIDGKARLVSETYCDGLGACLAECPQGALTIEERDAAGFDEAAVEQHLERQQKPSAAPPSGGCPGAAAFAFGAADRAPSAPAPQPAASALRQWPVQLHLVPVEAPYWQDVDLLVAADCVPVACATFHQDLLAGRRLVIACPKLDETSSYVGKLAAILQSNRIRSVTVAHMEVPCCHGLVHLARMALEESGKDIPFETVNVSVRDGGMAGVPASASPQQTPPN